MVELADTLVSETSAERREGSTPSLRTQAPLTQRVEGRALNPEEGVRVPHGVRYGLVVFNGLAFLASNQAVRVRIPAGPPSRHRPMAKSPGSQPGDGSSILPGGTTFPSSVIAARQALNLAVRVQILAGEPQGEGNEDGHLVWSQDLVGSNPTTLTTTQVSLLRLVV